MKLFYTSDEVAQHFEITLSTLEHYLKFFSIVIKKVGKNRRYTDKDINKLRTIIDLIQTEGYTLEGAKEKLKEKKIISLKDQEVVDRLKEIKNTLILIKNGLQDAK